VLPPTTDPAAVSTSPGSAPQSTPGPTRRTPSRSVNASPSQQAPSLTAAVHHALRDPFSAAGHQEVCFKACVARLPSTEAAVPQVAGSMDTDAVSVLPYERRDGCPPEKLSARFVTFLVDAASFDRRAFNLSALEAKWTDPQQRLLAENAAGALACCAHSLGV
jgi:hypothetical protein